MIAGLLALMLVTADTTMRFAPAPDTLGEPIAVLADTVRATIVPATVVPTTPVDSTASAEVPRSFLVTPDTLVKKKRVLVEYSEWYGRRLAVHRVLSWTMLPLFAVSYYTGTRLADDGRAASPNWVRTLHPYAATGAAVTFGVNTVTGVWNLWDARHDPEGRTRRLLHAALFIAADAGFAWAGSIGAEARDNGAIRARHRTIAISSMGVSTLGWLIMLVGR